VRGAGTGDREGGGDTHPLVSLSSRALFVFAVLCHVGSKLESTASANEPWGGLKGW
jgi:hypothetical protein